MVGTLVVNSGFGAGDGMGEHGGRTPEVPSCSIVSFDGNLIWMPSRDRYLYGLTAVVHVTKRRAHWVGALRVHRCKVDLL
jgi:hypothetical protein